MFYQDYQAIARLRQEETEQKARHAWKFFEQAELKKHTMAPKEEDKCCLQPAQCSTI